MGGATFPTDIKAVTAQGRVDTILVNACECEPYITADDALLCSYPEQIFRGLAALDAALHPDRRVIAVEDNKSEAIAILRRAPARLAGSGAGRPTHPLPPGGGETAYPGRYRPAGAHRAICPSLWAVPCLTQAPWPPSTGRCTRASR